MFIGCLGMNANPPHMGHIANAEILLESGFVEEVLFIPPLKNPFGKPDEAPWEDRLRMCELICEELGNNRMKVSSIEGEFGGVSYTVNTLEVIRRRNPNDTFYWAVGSDIVVNKEYLRWHKWESNLSKDTILVIERPGYPLKNIRMPGCFVRIGEVKADPMSSTKIRSMIRDGQDMTKYLGKKVPEHIEAQNLYK